MLQAYKEHEKVINEEYKIWKTTVPMLYESIQTYSLEWPSLTVDWLPGLETLDDKQQILTKFIVGTHTSGKAQDYVKLYSLKLPATLHPDSVVDHISSESYPKGCKFELLRQWEHPGEVNKARYNRLNGKIATLTNTGDVLLYNSSNESSPTKLRYHQSEGFGLEWHPVAANTLISATEDKTIALWNVETPETPSEVWTSHSAGVNDLSWNQQHHSVFASVSDDLSLQIHDIRIGNSDDIIVPHSHDSAVNSVAFNPAVPHLLVTGSSDNTIGCWDMRNLAEPFRRLIGHTDGITQLEFSSTSPQLLSSTSFDRRVNVWDLSQLDQGDFDNDEYEKSPDEYHDPCLKFIHGGHTTKLCETQWHPELPNVLITCAEDSLVDVWKWAENTRDESEQESGKDSS